ncbi:hypothetical protein ABPG77_005525 [Micractinium sp. CCAP 211/92]
MLQVETFLQQAQALLQRLEGVATSPLPAAHVAAASQPQLELAPTWQLQEQPPVAAQSLHAETPSAVQPTWESRWQEQQGIAVCVSNTELPAEGWDGALAAEPSPHSLQPDQPRSSAAWGRQAGEVSAGVLTGQEAGSYVQAARQAKERAAREAAERERQRRENVAARRAATQRALLEKQRQQDQGHTEAQRQRLYAPQQPGSRTAAGGGAYLQRLQGRQARQRRAPARLPEWAQPARLLPPLLVPGGKSDSPAEQHAEPSQRPASAGSFGQSARPIVKEAEQALPALQNLACVVEAAAAVEQAVGVPSAEQKQQPITAVSIADQQGLVQGAVLPCRRLSDGERELQLLQAELSRLDSRMAQRGHRIKYSNPATAVNSSGTQASVELCSRANSELQRQLQASLQRLDGQLAVASLVATGEHPPLLQYLGQKQVHLQALGRVHRQQQQQ